MALVDFARLTLEIERMGPEISDSTIQKYAGLLLNEMDEAAHDVLPNAVADQLLSRVRAATADLAKYR